MKKKTHQDENMPTCPTDIMIDHSRNHPENMITTDQPTRRRNLTPAWLIELELGNKADLLEIGKKTQGKRTDLLSQDDKKLDKHPVNTQKEIAKSAGVSTGQVGMDANQLGRRNLSPDAFRLALGRRYNRTKKAEHDGGKGKPRSGDQNEPNLRTAAKLASNRAGRSFDVTAVC